MADRRADAWLRWPAVALLGAGVVGAVAGGRVASATLVLVSLLVAFSSWAALLALCRQGRGLDGRAALAATGLLAVVCVAFPPAASRDVGSYAMYGRMVAAHHASPYTHRPDDWPDDPWLAEVAPVWRGTASVYGPAFTALSAAGMGVAGTSKLGGRLVFQGLAALAVVAAAGLVARRTGDGGAVAFVGLNPLILASVVNGGHNDALVGLGVLAAVLAAERRRWGWAGAALAMAVGVKVAAALAVPALAVWAWRAHGRRAAAVVVGTAAALVGAGYLAVGGPAALTPVRHAAGQVSRSSVWRPVVSLVGGHERSVGALASVVVLVLAVALVAVVWSQTAWCQAASPTAMVAGALAAFLLAGAYVLPWYHAWALLPLGLAWRNRAARVMAGVAAALLVAYVWQPGVGGAVGASLHVVARWVLPPLEVAGIVALLWPAPAPARRGALTP